METISLDLVRIFVKVVQHSSFSKAAAALKLPKSSVSKAVSFLEKETGTVLLMRTTRSLTLTAAGRAFFDSAIGPVNALEDAQRSLYGTDSILSGIVRITAPEDLGTAIVAPTIAKLCADNPNLNFELVYSDEILDLVKEGIDIAVRIGKVSESGFKIKRVGEVQLVPVASPEYLLRTKKILTPNDLTHHHCLTLRGSKLYDHWALTHGTKKMRVTIKPRVSCNQMSTLLKLAIEGTGVALVPYYLCKTELERGALKIALKDCASFGWPVAVITPQAPSHSARLKVTQSTLVTALSERLSYA